jgi:signal transduction histidine kinase
MEFPTNDLISQLPEPYRVAWEILRESLGYEDILRHVLTAAQEMAKATWGMMVLDTDFENSFNMHSFHTLPDIVDTKMPVGYLTSLAHVLARKVIRDGEGILIADTNNVIEVDVNHLLDEFLPLETRNAIAQFPSSCLAIPDTNSYTAMVVPILDKNEHVGALYLHAPLSQSDFNTELFEIIKTFMSCISARVKNEKYTYELIREFSQYSASVSCELRTPILSIQGYAEILLMHLEGVREGLVKNKEEEKEFVGIILKNAKRLIGLLNDLLIHARIERNLISKTSINLMVEINRIVDKYRELAKYKKQTITATMSDGLEVDFQIDPYLVSLIDSFVNHGYIFSPEGEEIKLYIALENSLFAFRMSGISDEGINIDYFAKRFIKLSGGQFGTERSPNHWNTFWFTIPVSKE